jgi:hypothetical protein
LRVIEELSLPGLTAISIPASVEIIGERAFKGATLLASVTYECSTTPLLVGIDAFSSTSYATSGMAAPAACRVIDLRDDCSAVVNGKLVVPSSLKRINRGAYSNCGALKTIEFASPSNLQSIDDFAFAFSGITAIIIPASVRFIGENAFDGAYSLVSVTYACSTTPLSVDVSAFANTPYAAYGVAAPDTACRVVNLPLDCSNFVGGKLVVPSSVKMLKMPYCTNFGVATSIEFASPSQVQVISDKAFAYNIATAVHIPASVRIVGEGAFRQGYSLESVTYECSTTPLQVDWSAFSGTPYALNGLALPAASCRVIDFSFDCANVADGNIHISKSWRKVSTMLDIFGACTSVTSVTYDADSQLETIGRRAFRGSRIVSIWIPATVKLIAFEAFAESLLETVTYECSDQPLYIGIHAFMSTLYEANGLAVPAASCRKIEFALDATNAQDGNLLVPAATTRINSGAFFGKDNMLELKRFAIFTSVTFEQGSRLKVIAENAFESSYLTSIDIPMSVESIEDGAFSGSFALSSMTFSCSSHLLTIAANAFDGTALTSIALPPGAVYEGQVEVTALQCPTTAGPVTCNAGQYLKNKGESDEVCQACPAGKFTRSNDNRNKKCRRCSHGAYQPEEGQNACLKCPKGFRSRGQKGGPNCYHKKTGRPMRPSDLLTAEPQ